MCTYMYVYVMGGQPSSIYLVSDPGCSLLRTLLLNAPSLCNGTVTGLLPPGAVMRSKEMV